ncbi:MAG: glucokinase [bacterium]
MRLLVGDVGGTNTRLALIEGEAVVARLDARNAEHPGLEPLVGAFVERYGRPDAGCVAVAGPVRGGQVEMTNLDWQISEAVLCEAAEAPCRLINDFHAQALAMPRLAPEHYATIGGGEVVADAPRVVIGAGTGLGEAFLIPSDGGWIAVPGEGGHGRYAPRGELEVGLLGHLAERHGAHVSVERVVSGPGLVEVYDWLRGERPRLAAMHHRDPAAVITEEALAGGDPACVAAVELFIGALGDEAANLALKVNAGLVYLTGGIAPKIRPLLRARLRAAFEGKGRYSAWAATVPIRLVLHPDPGLLGAQVMAEQVAAKAAEGKRSVSASA